MKVARIAILAVALVAGITAWLLARDTGGEKTEPVIVEQTIETEEVLVAARDIEPGETVSTDDLTWQRWPSANVNDRFIRRDEAETMDVAQAGTVARSYVFAGEPLRSGQLVQPGKARHLSAGLPSGMRAVATRISAQSGVAGFILPNDHVDVIVTRSDISITGTSDYVSERVLSDIRVLAIDQTVEEQDGQEVVVGSVATLELTPEQAEELALAEQLGDISLSLRSIMDGIRGADGNVRPLETVQDRQRSRGVNVVRFGKPSRVNAN